MAAGSGDGGGSVTSGESHSAGQDGDSSSAESSDTEDSSDGDQSPRPRKNEMRRLVSVIYRQIQSWSYIIHFDKGEIMDKMRKWALDRCLQYEEPIGAPNLISRLAIANTKRREQLRIWQSRPNRPACIGAQQTKPAEGHLAASSGFHRARPPQSQPRQIGSEPTIATISEVTKQDFPLTTKPVLDGSGAASNLDFESSAPRKLRHPGLLDIPRPQPGRLTFDCPFCFSELEVGITQTWEDHVFGDLRPYACTFERCDNAEKLYSTRHEWFYHETQIHRRRWVCASCCNSSFSTKVHLEQHMRAKHEGEFAELQLPILLDICERPAEPEGMTNCPLCPAALELCHLQDRLARHLEDLACLFFLLTRTLPLEALDRVGGH